MDVSEVRRGEQYLSVKRKNKNCVGWVEERNPTFTRACWVSLCSTQPTETLNRTVLTWGDIVIVPFGVYQSLFKLEFIKMVIQRFQLKLIVYDPIQEAIVEWKN